jgi:hypothetical protein
VDAARGLRRAWVDFVVATAGRNRRVGQRARGAAAGAAAARGRRTRAAGVTRKALATIGAGPYAALLELGLPALEAYADRHGWALELGEGELADGRPPSWAKVPHLLELVERYELVAWLDADTLVVDGRRDLELELRAGRDLYLVEHTVELAGGRRQVTANAGVMLLRSGPWARALLEAVWAQVELVEHVWWENAALMRLLGYRVEPPTSAELVAPSSWHERVAYLELAWNSLPHLGCSAPAPYVVHYGGLELDERRARMLADAGRTVSA